MPLIRHAEYRPDVSDYMGSASRTVLNVVPQGDGYGPFPGFSGYTIPLPAPCRGAFYALKNDGSVITFAGTSDRLYQLNNTDYSWKPVSVPAAVTSISNASPAVITYTNIFAAGDPVAFSTTGALPTGLTAGTTYYVIAAGLSGTAFSVSATKGGAAINTSSAGSGTHSVTSTYPAVSVSAQWQFVQTGNLVFATHANVPLQVIDLTSGSPFAAALGSPPQAAYISVVGPFLVLSGLLSLPYRIQWSGLNNFNSSTSWTSGLNFSDFQDFPDGGLTRGIAGGTQSGIIFQDQLIRSMAYVPGSPLVFQIDKIAEGMGLFAPYSIIRAGGNIFFYAGQGFHKIGAGGAPIPIGRERIDRTFIKDLDIAAMGLFMGAADPRSTRVYWAYKSTAGATGAYDKLLGYDFLLDRFFPVKMSGQFLLGVSQSGITLEALDAIAPGGSIDAMTLSLDNYPTAVQPQFGQFDATGAVGFFSGPALEATIQTGEQGDDWARLDIRGFKPITDAPAVFGSLFYRDTQQKAPLQSPEVGLSSRTGRVDMMRDARYARFQTRIPAGTVWTNAVGIVPDFGEGAET